MIIKCDCGADPCGRWKQPPAIIFHDFYWPNGSRRRDPDFVRSCRSCLSERREEETQARERTLGWPKGGLR
jgi:hypothetical protein